MASGGSHPAAAFQLSLTDEFALTSEGRVVGLPHSVERVVAYLGLRLQPVHRAKLAGVLWPDAPGGRAARSLRTALWRLGRGGVPIVDHHEGRVALSPCVQVDVVGLFDLCHRLIELPDDPALEQSRVLVDHGELLPDWDDEWVVADRERFRILRLQALESAAATLIDRGELGRAVEAALAAALSDPLRESARRLLIRVHLAEGNVASALQAFEEYRALLDLEVGVEPSSAMQALFGSSTAA
jgi:DNA-binding SARP family transcriptional activator